MALCLPRNSCAAWLASRPSTTSDASITCQAWVTSPGLGLYVRTDMPLRWSRVVLPGRMPLAVLGTTWSELVDEPEEIEPQLHNAVLRRAREAHAKEPPHTAARHTDHRGYRAGVDKVKTTRISRSRQRIRVSRPRPRRTGPPAP